MYPVVVGNDPDDDPAPRDHKGGIIELGCTLAFCTFSQLDQYGRYFFPPPCDFLSIIGFERACSDFHRQRRMRSIRSIFALTGRKKGDEIMESKR